MARLELLAGWTPCVWGGPPAYRTPQRGRAFPCPHSAVDDKRLVLAAPPADRGQRRPQCGQGPPPRPAGDGLLLRGPGHVPPQPEAPAWVGRGGGPGGQQGSRTARGGGRRCQSLQVGGLTVCTRVSQNEPGRLRRKADHIQPSDTLCLGVPTLAVAAGIQQPPQPQHLHLGVVLPCGRRRGGFTPGILASGRVMCEMVGPA